MNNKFAYEKRLSVEAHNDTKEIDLKKIKRKNRVRVMIPVMIAAVLACTLFYVTIGNPVMPYRSFQLEQAVQSIDEKEVTLNEVVPFESSFCQRRQSGMQHLYVPGKYWI